MLKKCEHFLLNKSWTFEHFAALKHRPVHDTGQDRKIEILLFMCKTLNNQIHHNIDLITLDVLDRNKKAATSYTRIIQQAIQEL